MFPRKTLEQRGIEQLTQTSLHTIIYRYNINFSVLFVINFNWWI